MMPFRTEFFWNIIITNRKETVMTFQELFSEWKQRYCFDAFISDGIVDSTNYAHPHILFVLRDMNLKWKQDRDLCEDLRCDGSGWKTWNNVGRWTAALLDGDPAYPFDMSTDKRVAQLKRVAVMNLKKEGGGSRTDRLKLDAAVQKQALLIRREISMCTPKLIVCCGLPSGKHKGNADLLKNYVFESSTQWMTFRSALEGREWGYYYADIDGNQIPVISFCHPQVSALNRLHGHEDLFKPLYQDMLTIRKMFL